MSSRRWSRDKRISSVRTKRRRRSQKGGIHAKLKFADMHHLAHQISSATKQTATKATQNFGQTNDELATAILKGVERGRQLYKEFNAAPARVIGQAIDKKAKALREQGKDAAAESLEASKEMAMEEVQTALRAIAQKEIGFVENMTVATAAEIVSEVPGVGPLAGEAIEGVYNQGKAVFDAKAEFDEKMEGIREKAATLKAKKDKLVSLATGSLDAEDNVAIQKEIDDHETELRKHYDDMALLENRLEKEIEEFTALARDPRIKVYDNVNRLNNIVVQVNNNKVTKEWEDVLISLDNCIKAEDPEVRRRKLKDFEKKLNAMEGLERKQEEFKKLSMETSNILDQGLEIHHSSRPRSKGGAAPATTKHKLEMLQTRRQSLSEARKRLRKQGFPV